MKISDTVSLKDVLAAHAEWAKDYCGLKGASLSDERRADLSRADLRRADLRRADLSGADLRRVDLRRADLRRADLRGADLGGADLSGADLSGADLRRVDLSGAYLSGADLSRAYLRGATGFAADENRHVFWIIPEVGSFIGWKKLQDGIIAKLQIPDKAKRTCNLQGRKCRAEYVKTIALYKDGKPFKGVGIALHDGKTKYEVGKITRSDSYDDSPFIECSHGVHFFVTQQEAEAY